jgi:hypothetical protein
VYIYSPSKLSHERFITSVKGIAHNCARSLLKQYNHDRLAEALQSTHEKKIHGGKPCAVPGGYKFAIGIALLFLEEHPEGTFVLETYNNKQKNLDLSKTKIEWRWRIFKIPGYENEIIEMTQKNI